MRRLDCVIIVDGELTLMAERQLELLLGLHARGKIKTGIFTLWRARTTLGWPASIGIRKLIDGDILTWLDPKGSYAANLALVLSPGFSGVAKTRLPRLAADHVLIWPIEPPRRGQEPLFQQAPALAKKIGEQFGKTPIWCARTASERHHLAREAIGLDLAPVVWWPLLGDPGRSLERPDRARRHGVGRHWQDHRPLGPAARNELAEAFGDPWPMDLAFHGEREVLESLPPFHESQGLRLIEPDDVTRQVFLQDLALFTTLGAADDPFGVPFDIFEAFAADVLVVGPPYLASAIDASLPTVDPAEMPGLTAHLLSDHRAYDQAFERQRQLCFERHTAFVYRARINDYLGRPAGQIRPSAVMPDNRRKDRVLFVSDDSPHLEHVARVLAIADKLPDPLTPFFVTTGRNASLIEQLGHPVEFTTPHNSPSYRAIGHGADGWNFWFERQFAELLAFVDPRAVVFDGVYPFGGMMANRKRYPDIPFIWLRQPLWRPSAKLDALALGPQLDLVIEPGDLAADFDRGPTNALADHVLPTPPILTAELLTKEGARRLLGIPSGDVAILVDGSLPAEVLGSDAVIVLLSGLVDGGASLWAFDHPQSGPSTVASLDLDINRIDDPSALNCRASFDGAVFAGSYHGLHDQAAARLPTIFVTGLGSSNDDQAARVAYAERRGWGQALRQQDVYGARDAIDRLLDTDRRQAMASCFENDLPIDGAEEAAMAIAETIFSLALGETTGDGMPDRTVDAAD